MPIHLHPHRTVVVVSASSPLLHCCEELRRKPLAPLETLETDSQPPASNRHDVIFVSTSSPPSHRREDLRRKPLALFLQHRPYLKHCAASLRISQQNCMDSSNEKPHYPPRLFEV